MMHYWTAKQICLRLGWKAGTSSKLPELIKKYSIPAWPRVSPRNKFKRTYYASEQALLAWEFATASLYRQKLLAKEEEKQGGV